MLPPRSSSSPSHPPFILYGSVTPFVTRLMGWGSRPDPGVQDIILHSPPRPLSPSKITASCLLFKVSHQRQPGGGEQGEEQREAERCLHSSPLRRSKWTIPLTPRHHNGFVESEREPSLLKML